VAKDEGRRELAIRSVTAVIAGGTSLAGPEAGAAATALTPLMEDGLSRIYHALFDRRRSHAAETLLDAADAAGATTDDQFTDIVEQAVSDSQRQELLARTLIIAQDTALRDKRRALGRALAAGIEADGARVDDELLFIRVLADLDAPHVRLLHLMNTPAPHLAQDPRLQGIDARIWMPWSISEADPGLAETVYALLLPLERHGLIWNTGGLYHTPGGAMEQEYRISTYGEWFLQRLAAPEEVEKPPT
jgi:hypothetical protein